MYFSVSFVAVLSLGCLCEGKTIYRSSAKKGGQKCGTYVTRSGKIVGGVDSFEGEFPWMVSLKSSAGHFCGGFVVSERHVVSAAHCFHQRHAKDSGIKFDDSGKIIVSSFNATIGEFSLKSPETVPDIHIPISKLMVHSEYNTDTRSNDIAVIELSKKVSIHPNVEPLCLPTTKASFPLSKKATAAGWGLDNFYQSTNAWKHYIDKLQKVEVSLQDTQECVRAYSVSRREVPSTGVICGGKKGQQSCSGDSGGPLMILKDKKWTAVGVISFGVYCGEHEHPEFYTDISHYKEWIDEQMR